VRTGRVEVTIAAVTAAGVVAVGVLEALVFAVGATAFYPTVREALQARAQA
jgi:hypothetical protein